MFRVPAMAIAQLDLRLLLFAGLIAACAAFVSLHTLGHGRDSHGRARGAWLILAGATAAAGFWATQFLAIRAYEWGAPTAYNPGVVALALLAGTIVITAGLALAMPEGRWQAAAGGAVVGLGMVLGHVVGMKALDLPGVLHANRLMTVPVNVMTVALCCAALLPIASCEHRRALWVGASLLALAACGLHFVAAGTTAVTLDPAIAVSASGVSGPTFAIVVACTTALIMVTAKVATLLAAQASREAELDLRRRHDLLVQREEELSRQNLRFDMALTSLPQGLSMVDAERRLVVCNKPFADMYGIPPELTKPGTPISALVEHRIASGIYCQPRRASLPRRGLGSGNEAHGQDALPQ